MSSEGRAGGKCPQLPSNSSPNELGGDSEVGELTGTCDVMNFLFFSDLKENNRSLTSMRGFLNCFSVNLSPPRISRNRKQAPRCCRFCFFTSQWDDCFGLSNSIMLNVLDGFCTASWCLCFISFPPPSRPVFRLMSPSSASSSKQPTEAFGASGGRVRLGVTPLTLLCFRKLHFFKTGKGHVWHEHDIFMEKAGREISIRTKSEVSSSGLFFFSVYGFSFQIRVSSSAAHRLSLKATWSLLTFSVAYRRTLPTLPPGAQPNYTFTTIGFEPGVCLNSTLFEKHTSQQKVGVRRATWRLRIAVMAD